MNATPVAVYYGSVADFAPSFRDGKFQPFNPAYSTFVPSSEPVNGPCGAILEIFEGEWFSVDVAQTADTGPNLFLHYPDALRRSRRSGVYGGTAYINICTPAEDRIVTALDADGSEVPVFREPRQVSTRLASRLIFPNR